jgi:hypothetical protein
MKPLEVVEIKPTTELSTLPTETTLFKHLKLLAKQNSPVIFT